MNATDQNLSLNKLIILYMLDKTDAPLSNTLLSNFILDNNYSDYFSLQEYVHQLIESDMVKEEEIAHNTHYHITPFGSETLAFFINRIPDSTLIEMDGYLEAHSVEIKSRVEIVANYIPGMKGEFLVECYVKDDDILLMELKMTVFDKESAKQICDKWKADHVYLYKEFLMKLISD